MEVSLENAITSLQVERSGNESFTLMQCNECGQCLVIEPLASKANSVCSQAFATAYCQHAEQFYTSQQWAKAIIFYSKAVSVSPDHIDALYRLGLTQRELHKGPDALESLQRVVELDAGHLDASFRLGVLLHEASHHEQALEHLNNAITLSWDQIQSPAMGPQPILDCVVEHTQHSWSTQVGAHTCTAISLIMQQVLV